MWVSDFRIPGMMHTTKRTVISIDRVDGSKIFHLWHHFPAVLVRNWTFGLGGLLASGFTNRSENTYHLQMCARLPRSVQPEIVHCKCNMLHGNKRAAKPSVLLYAIVLIATSVSSGFRRGERRSFRSHPPTQMHQFKTTYTVEAPTRTPASVSTSGKAKNPK
jgi:hypothetical protein